MSEMQGTLLALAEDLERVAQRMRTLADLAVEPPRPAPQPPAPSTRPGMKNERIWFTTRQAAERVGRHPDTVRRLLEAGEMHGGQSTPGRSSWRIHRDCLDAWAKHQPCPHANGGDA